MQYTDIEDYMNDILVLVDGCPHSVVLTAIISVLRSFCRDTKVLMSREDIFTLSNNPKYEVPSDSYTTVVRVERVSYNGAELSTITESEAERISSDWENDTGEPQYYIMLDLSTMRLYPKPDSSSIDSLTVSASLMPKATATKIDTEFFDLYYDAIVSGAAAKLMAMPNKPWSDPKIAAYHSVIFDRGKSAATARKTKGFGRKPLRTITYCNI
jgi:hypothetical protein